MPLTIQSIRSGGLSKRQRVYVQRIIREIRKQYGNTDKAMRAADCAIATALVESNIQVYANGNNPESLKIPHDAVGWDHGSVGIYQQQVGGAKNSTANWGTTEACMDIGSSTAKFVRALMDKVWEGKTNGQLCQEVQGSAFPDRYAQRDKRAIKARKYLWNTPVSRGVK